MAGTPTRRIPVSGPWITEREISYAADAAQHGWYEHRDLYNVRFEEAFAEQVGVAHAISLSSRSAAIHLALAALEVGPGDEVIVPEIAGAVSIGPVLPLGATPVFADIDPVTWCVDAHSVEARLTPRTRAIIAVDLYGGVPDWAMLRDVADRYGIPIIEDAADAVGTIWADRPAGSFGDVAVFSFHDSKTISIGEGGMLVTNDDAVYSRCLRLRDEERRQAFHQHRWNDELVSEYRMSAVQAGLGLAQLERLSDLVDRKRTIFEWYLNGLGGLPGVTLNAEPDGVRNSYWMTTVLLDPGLHLRKEDVLRQLEEASIDARPFFDPLSSLPAFIDLAGAERASARNPVSYALSPYGVNLPSAMRLSGDDVDYVCATMRRILGY